MLEKTLALVLTIVSISHLSLSGVKTYYEIKKLKLEIKNIEKGD